MDASSSTSESTKQKWAHHFGNYVKEFSPYCFGKTPEDIFREVGAKFRTLWQDGMKALIKSVGDQYEPTEGNNRRYEALRSEALASLYARAGHWINSISRLSAWEQAYDELTRKPQVLPDTLRSHPSFRLKRPPPPVDSDHDATCRYHAYRIHAVLLAGLSPYFDRSSDSNPEFPTPPEKNDSSYVWEVWRSIGAHGDSLEKNLLCGWSPPTGKEFDGLEPYATVFDEDGLPYSEFAQWLGLGAQIDHRSLTTFLSAYPQTRGEFWTSGNKDMAVSLLIIEALATEICEMTFAAVEQHQAWVDYGLVLKGKTPEEFAGMLSRLMQTNQQKAAAIV